MKSLEALRTFSQEVVEKVDLSSERWEKLQLRGLSRQALEGTQSGVSTQKLDNDNFQKLWATGCPCYSC